MIDINEIEDEIAKLEHGNTTYNSCERLSILYQVRNNFRQNTPAPVQNVSPYSYAESEFATAFRTAGDEALKILDEHFEIIRVLYPKEYQKVIDMLRSSGTM